MPEFSIYAVFDQPENGFYGNTAAVLLTDEFPAEEHMQRIAADFNQPATTFLCKSDGENTFNIRWFAPDAEIGLCGHGTLAAIAHLGSQKIEGIINLIAGTHRLSGKMIDDNSADMVIGSIPVNSQTSPPDQLEEALGVKISGYYSASGKDIVLLASEDAVKNMKPDFNALKKIDVFGYAVTAPGKTVDFVSRTLVPHVQQLEDHATGSSHAALVPFWAKRLNKEKMEAIQHSPRGGYFKCEYADDFTMLAGHYTKFVTGTLFHSTI